MRSYKNPGDLPRDCIGVLDEANNKAYCRDHVPADFDIDDDDVNIVLSTDDWASDCVELCADPRCDRLISDLA